MSADAKLSIELDSNLKDGDTVCREFIAGALLITFGNKPYGVVVSTGDSKSLSESSILSGAVFYFFEIIKLSNLKYQFILHKNLKSNIKVILQF